MYGEYSELGKIIKEEFLKAYFGENFKIQRFAEQMIYQNRQDVAKYLNNVIRVMGEHKNNEDAYKLVLKTEIKFNLDKNDLLKKEQRLMDEKEELEIISINRKIKE
jgi:hypothetical protein